MSLDLKSIDCSWLVLLLLLCVRASPTPTAAALNIKFAFYFRSGMHVTFFLSVVRAPTKFVNCVVALLFHFTWRRFLICILQETSTVINHLARNLYNNSRVFFFGCAFAIIMILIQFTMTVNLFEWDFPDINVYCNV